jgi:unsaturated chondroitin disaccharide hydrolase
MITVRTDLTPQKLQKKLERLFELSAEKIRLIDREWDPSRGTPVFTIEGKYTTRGWTEWTQGFQFGSAILQFDAARDPWFLDYGRSHTVKLMASHLTHVGVHDHGFNNVSTYGNLLRLQKEGILTDDRWERNFYEVALKCSSAVQAARWTEIFDGRGYIYSFNGPHSLFADTIRSLRVLAVGHRLGHVLMGEKDRRISLLGRLIDHASVTAEFAVYYGEGRDSYDVRGRVAHESIFNLNDGNYRCPNSQQGYSPFTTWTRGLAWIVCGYPEELEFLATLEDGELEPHGGRARVEGFMMKAARATADYFLQVCASDGIPYWDTGAGKLHRLGDEYLDKPSDPYNAYEPVDSSATAIAAQGIWRLGKYLKARGEVKDGERYLQAALTMADTLFGAPYLSEDPKHQGLILHSIYHRPNGWDHVPAGQKIPCGESSMWGDYHAREFALLLLREARGEPCLNFFNI